MALRDTPKQQIRQALFPRRRRPIPPPKISVSEKWYTKTPVTMNVKLRQAIINALPFDMNKQRADLALRTVFNTIIKGLETDKSITIPGFGRFKLILIKGCWKGQPLPSLGHTKFAGKHTMSWVPDHYKVTFRPCLGIREVLTDKETDGDCRTDQGT